MTNYYSGSTKVHVKRRVYKQLKLTYTVLSMFIMLQINAQSWENTGSSESVSAGGSSYNNLVTDGGGNYYLSYYDTSVSKGSVQKFNGTAWSYLDGTAGITTGAALYNTLSLDGLGNAYYTNQGSGLEAMQFNGTSWSQLAGATPGTINYHASAVADSNVLFTFFGTDSGTVKRYINGSWEQVGATGFSGSATFAEMVMGTNNTVYTCNVAGGYVQVYQNSTTATATDAWALVGATTVGAAASSEQYTSDIAIDANNNIYVAYVSNTAGGQKLNVKKFDGTAWVQLGTANFSAGKVQHVAIAVTPGGVPYVAASRWENDDFLRNMVYKYDTVTSTWGTYGGTFISAGQATFNDLIVDTANNYLVLAFSEGTTKVKRIAITPEAPVTVCSGTDPGLTTGDTGCVSFNYAGQTVAYTTVRAADGKIWLQQNLGSDNVAGTVADETGYGDIFQWGRWADGHQKRTSEVSSMLQTPNNPAGLNGGVTAFIASLPAWWSGNALTDTWAAETPAGASDTNGCDPCKALGEGWQLPAQADWTALVTAENISNPATAFNSSLKLPATGYRSSSSGSYTFVGTRGYYWSADVANTGGKYLYIGTASANAGSGAPRGQGAAIRCIKMAQQNQVASVAVTTLNNVVAVITATGGTLQLAASITPATANQNVTWSVTSGSTMATVNANGLVTAVANGTAVIRATSVADATKYGELNVVIDIPPVNNCPALTSLYENFDSLSCCASGVVPTCWNSILLGGASQIISSTQPASGTSQIYQNGYGAGKISIVVLPQLSNINAGTHQFRFKVKANSTGLLDFGYITDVTDAATFVAIESLTINNSSYNTADAERVFTVPVTVPATARLAVRNPGTSFAGIYWDDVYWEPIPVASVLVTTQNNAPAEITTENGTLQLVATVNPAGVNQNVTWSIVSGSEFATVDANGLVTATANGTVVIRATATADATKFDDIEITVNYTVVIPVTSVDVTVINNAPAEITTENGTLQLVATVNPAAVDQNVIWSIVSGSEFATVDANGLVTATANGTLVIRATATADASKFDDIEITVNYTVVIPVTSVDVTVINNAPAEITTENGTLQLVATVNPAAVDQNVTWNIVSGSGFATVDANGLVTATANGTVVIRATSTADATKFDDIEVVINITLGLGDVTKNNFSIYPNPTKGTVTIRSDKEIRHVKIYNQLGQLILAESTASPQLSGMQEGIYIMEVEFKDTTRATCKIIKN